MQALGQGINLLFGMVDEMDFSASQAFANWIATHLVNTQLTWPYWAQWANSIKEDNDGKLAGPRAYFCKSIVDALSRRALPQSVFPSLMGVTDFENWLQKEGDAQPVIKMPPTPEGDSDSFVSSLRQKLSLEKKLKWYKIPWRIKRMAPFCFYKRY